MELKVKVCGMRDPKNILKIAALNPDFMGFIFYNKSKRYVGEDFSIPKNFPNEIKRVGVFVNEGREKILRQVSKHQLDFVQLHGDESPEMCESLASEVSIIKAFHVDSQFDFESTKPYALNSDFFMFETKSDTYGGTGKSFDWTLLKKYDQDIPFFLTGGLSNANIAEVKEIKNKSLFALDINSGAETEPGVKDAEILNSIFHILNIKK